MTDDDIETKASDIQETRDDMTATVEAIGDRLDPGNIVRDAKETVREATVGKVETMAEQAGSMVQDAGATVQSTGSSVLTTIQRHPVASAMAGLGLAWLVTHREGGTPTRRSTDWDRYGSSSDRWDRRRAWDSEEAWRSGSGSRADQGSPIEGLQQRAGDAADAVGDRFADVGQQVGQMPQRIGGSAQDFGQTAERSIEESPLAVGAVALAVGTAIGLALPTSRIEREMIGPASGRILESAEQTATQALRDARDQVESSSSSGSKTGQSEPTGA